MVELLLLVTVKIINWLYKCGATGNLFFYLITVFGDTDMLEQSAALMLGDGTFILIRNIILCHHN